MDPMTAVRGQMDLLNDLLYPDPTRDLARSRALVTDGWDKLTRGSSGALDCARRAIKYAKKNADAWALLAACLSNLDQDNEALDAAQKAVSLDPHNGLAQLFLGSALVATG